MKKSAVELGELAEFINGYAFKPADWNPTGKPIIRIQNLSKAGASFNYTQSVVPAKYKISNGDLLVSWSATLGVFKWDGPEALVNQHIFKVVPDRKKVDPEYLFHAIDASIHEMERYTHGSTMKHINRGEFLSHKIPLPPLEEQRRIAAILDNAGTLRQKRKQAITLLDSLTQSIFLEMFGDPIENSRGWERRKLSQILNRIDSGWSPSCLDRPAAVDEWGVLKLSAVTSGRFQPNEQKALPKELSPRPELEVHEGDVLFTRKNTHALVAACTFVSHTRSKLLLSDLIFRLIPNDHFPVEKSFLAACLAFPSMRKSIQKLAGGAAGSMPNISKAKLLDVQVIVPSLDRQTNFAKRIEKVETLRDKLLLSEEGISGAFSSLQHRAFSGEL